MVSVAVSTMCMTELIFFDHRVKVNDQVKSSQVAFNEWVWQSHKLTIKIQLINVQTQKNIAQKHIAQKLIAQNTCEKNN